MKPTQFVEGSTTEDYVRYYVGSIGIDPGGLNDLHLVVLEQRCESLPGLRRLGWHFFYRDLLDNHQALHESLSHWRFACKPRSDSLSVAACAPYRAGHALFDGARWTRAGWPARGFHSATAL